MTYSNGQMVKFTDAKMHQLSPDFYPPVGTVGRIVNCDNNNPLGLLVQWLDGTTSADDMWFCNPSFVTDIL